MTLLVTEVKAANSTEPTIGKHIKRVVGGTGTIIITLLRMARDA